MTDTTATVRKEILEDAKAEIDAAIDLACSWREVIQNAAEATDDPSMMEKLKIRVVDINKEIDRLMSKKDNLPQTLFHDEIEPTEAEAQALERRLAQLAEDGTHPSPIISGGDIVEIIPQAGDDDIPF